MRWDAVMERFIIFQDSDYVRVSAYASVAQGSESGFEFDTGCFRH